MKRELSPAVVVIVIVVLALAVIGGATWVWMGPSVRGQDDSTPGVTAPIGTPEAAAQRRERARQMREEMFGRYRRNRQPGGGAAQPAGG